MSNPVPPTDPSADAPDRAGAAPAAAHAALAPQGLEPSPAPAQPEAVSPEPARAEQPAGPADSPAPDRTAAPAAGDMEDVHPVPLSSVGQPESDFGDTGGQMLVIDTPPDRAPTEPEPTSDVTVVVRAEEDLPATIVIDSVEAEAAPVEPPVAAEQAQPPAAEQVAETAPPQAAPAQAPAGEQPAETGPANTVVVRYGLMRHLGSFRHGLDRPPSLGTKVVIRTERGVELGTVVIPIVEKPACDQGCGGCGGASISSSTLGQFLKANGPEYPFRRDGKVLRLANSQDVIDQRHLESSAGEEASYCRQQIKELALNMRLVTVEHLLGGERIIFYFSSEQRVDFRELVRRLAQQYRTRIEMRQVGARDEARLVGDYERCGQRCCCQEFLKDLRPVSMRMAKTQKATLDPAKISGRCGRLMCCLRYEDAVYEDLRKKLPRRNVWVRTADVVGKVIDTQIITQLVRLLKIDNTQVVVANEDILERNVEPPPAPKEREFERRPARDRSQMHPLRDEAPGGPRGEPAPAAPEPADEADEGVVVAPASDEDGAALAEPTESAAESAPVSEPAAPRPAGGPGGPGGPREGQDQRSSKRRRRGRRGRGGEGGQRPQGGQGGQGGRPPDQRGQGQRPPQQGGEGRSQQQGGEGRSQQPGGDSRRGRRRRKRRPGGGPRPEQGGQAGGGPPPAQ